MQDSLLFHLVVTHQFKKEEKKPIPDEWKIFYKKPRKITGNLKKLHQRDTLASAGEGKRGHLPPPPCPARIVCFSTFL